MKKITYKLRDWVFSRQRYWGEPIPLVWCEKCAKWVSLPDDKLPLTLPDIPKYQPTDNGESPLAVIEDWVKTTCPECGGDARRETDTMPNWAGSSWYFLRYIDSKNDEAFADPKKLKMWMPVDWYNGGMEHTTLHLLYSRFWNKFLFDRGLVPFSEPYAKRTSHGLILAEDGTKMSKSKGNVVNPDDIVKEFGADALRLFILFIGPFAEPAPWKRDGLVGMRRFIEKVLRLPEIIADKESEEITRCLHKTIKKVGEDIENMAFNTAVSSLMIFVNEVTSTGKITNDTLKKFLSVLSPFASHIAEEVWEKVGGKELVAEEVWPKYDSKLVVDDVVTIGVQVNGKVRGDITIAPTASESEARTIAEANENVAKHLSGNAIAKFVYVPGRIVNFVLKR
ncbi:MAG: class I tRNA ligase family protein [Patescibacteria group bacterium]